jgi:preprotein translocase subunit YajC
MIVMSLAQAAGAQAFVLQVIPIVAIIAIFYFLVIAPANKQRRKTETMLGGLKKGDRVVTSGGIYGVVQGVENDIVHLKIADNVKVRVAKSAVTGVTSESTSE